MSHRILVVDDDKHIVRLLQSYLEQAGFHVLTASNGADALRTIRTERPDLVLLDLMLPDRDGWDITRTIRADAQLARLPVIMLTARVEDTDKIIGLELGADDYITKPFNPREVVARIRSLFRRLDDAPARSTLIEIASFRMDRDRHEVTQDGVPIDLTPTEFELLRLFLENPGHVFTRVELMEQSLGYAQAGFDRTIDSHIKNLRKKIEPDSANPTYIQTVYGIGYRFRHNPS